MFNNIYVKIITLFVELYVAKIGTLYRCMIVSNIGNFGHIIIMVVIGIMVTVTLKSFKRERS